MLRLFDRPLLNSSCEDCNFESCNRNLYLRHMNQHAAGKDSSNGRCNLCGKEFKSRAGLNLHLKQHQDEGLFNVRLHLITKFRL